MERTTAGHHIYDIVVADESAHHGHDDTDGGYLSEQRNCDIQEFTEHAGGILRPLAYKEGIVTMLEFTWTHGSMLNSAEFRHGPLEVVESGVPFIFLLGTDASRHTTERALNFVKRYDSEVITFDYAELSEGLHPMLAPMVLFVPLEWFCYYLAIYKDHNPDDRRYYGGIVEY